jgi:putative PIN family toxin of toxin-antitoxin system
MKVVIDTNVLVSAVIRDRLPERVLRWCVGNESVSWLVSPAILAEYLKVIRRPRFALPAELIGWWSELLLSDTLMTQIIAAPDFPRDPKDAPFLACAGANGVDFLITGDAAYEHPAPPEVTLGERPSKSCLARRMAAGKEIDRLVRAPWLDARHRDARPLARGLPPVLCSSAST